MSQPITAGQEVTYQGEPYVVRSIDGNVLALEYHTGGFFRFVHLSSVTARSPSAIQTAATSLDAPAAGQGEGTSLEVFPAVAKGIDHAHQVRRETLFVEVTRFVAQTGDRQLAIALRDALQLYADEPAHPEDLSYVPGGVLTDSDRSVLRGFGLLVHGLQPTKVQQ